MRSIRFLMVAALVAAVSLTACSQTPAPTPTSAPAKAAEPTKAPAAPAATAPAKAAEPTKPVAAQPTAAAAAPAKKIDWPEKGKPITIISPWAVGDTNDVLSRLTAGYLEKELGTPVQVVNKPGASTQVGTTEFVKARPDGYTMLLWAMPAAATIYMDPERQSAYSRKDFVPLANAVVEPLVLAVRADSPFKSPKDLIDAAKANPGKLKAGNAGYLTGTHMADLALAKEGGVKFAHVSFQGSSEASTALLGGHIDFMDMSPALLLGPWKSGQIRLLGLTGKEESKIIPGVKTLESQGYKVNLAIIRGFVGLAGTPKEVTDTLTAALKKVLSDADFQKKATDAGLMLRYMDVPEYTAYWDDLDVQVKWMLDEAKAEQAKK